jgi:hypothetical protein
VEDLEGVLVVAVVRADNNHNKGGEELLMEEEVSLGEPP